MKLISLSHPVQIVVGKKRFAAVALVGEIGRAAKLIPYFDMVSVNVSRVNDHSGRIVADVVGADDPIQIDLEVGNVMALQDTDSP